LFFNKVIKPRIVREKADGVGDPVALPADPPADDA
jgi:hypothetical protein